MAMTTKVYPNQDHPLEGISSNPKMEVEEDYIQDNQEYEEILSLRDLPIYSRDSNDHYEDFFKENQRYSASSPSPSSSDDDLDLFQFFNEEWNLTTTTATTATTTATTTTDESNPPENIIFCGNLISPKQPISISLQKIGSITSRSNSHAKYKNKFLVQTPTVSGVKAPVKSKWYLVLFGLPPKVPTKMIDIRNRQSRRAPSRINRSEGGGEVVVAHRKREKCLWRLIKAATCFGGQSPMQTVTA